MSNLIAIRYSDGQTTISAREEVERLADLPIEPPIPVVASRGKESRTF
jgi:hypothetical protein